jgi:type IV secretion system protein VirD4
MQLPADDELVLISGCPPIRAKKARYYENRRLTERVIAPPTLVSRTKTDMPRSDDWSELASPPIVPNAQALLTSSQPPSRDPANAGIRQEPGLPRHEEIAPAPKKPAEEFTFTAENSDDEAARAQLSQLQARGLARQVAMDPKDGLEL